MYQPVVVTGASRGIGRELALAFARRKHDLVLCARSADLEADIRANLRREGFAGALEIMMHHEARDIVSE